MSAKSFRKWFEEAERDPEYWTQLAILEVTEEIFATMERQGVSRAELARRLGTSAAYITKILRGSANFTIESLARITRALGGEFRFHVAPKGTITKWKDVASSSKHSRSHSDASSSLVTRRNGPAVNRSKPTDEAYPLPVVAPSEVREVRAAKIGKPVSRVPARKQGKQVRNRRP
jgi:transcriptional regulator with XRE-family HTH domain